MQDWKKSFAARRDLVVSALNKISGLSCLTPSGAFYVFPNMQALICKKTPNGKTIANSAEFCDYLLEEALVAAVAGSAFGMEGYFRISYATSEKLLQTAMERIAGAVSKLG